MGERFSAQTAKGEDYDLAASDPPMNLFKFLYRRVCQNPDCGLRNTGISARYFQWIVPRFDKLCSQRKPLFTDPFTHPVEQYFIIIAIFAPRKLFFQIGNRRRQNKGGSVYQPRE